MEYRSYHCPECNGLLTYEDIHNHVTKCPYCDCDIYIDDGVQRSQVEVHGTQHTTVDVHRVDRKINDAEVIRAKTARMREEFWQSAITNEAVIRWIKRACIIGVIALAIFSGYAVYENMTFESKKSVMEAKELYSVGAYSDYVGKDHSAVEKILKSMGFKNVKAVDLKEVWFLSSENGKVSKISIDGNSHFHKTDFFPKTALIVIEYK